MSDENKRGLQRAVFIAHSDYGKGTRILSEKGKNENEKTNLAN